MIIKGKARANGGQLGAYLGDYLKSSKNERVQVLEVSGSPFSDLSRALASWDAEAQRTKCKKPIWFAAISPTHIEFLSREQKIEAANTLGRHLGLDGQPRAIVSHTKKDGSEHIHVAWSRIDRKTSKAVPDTFSHRTNAAAAREIEPRFGLECIANPQFRSDDKSKSRKDRREESKKCPTQNEFQASVRSEFDPRDRKETIIRLYQGSDSGKAFRSALQEAGFVLASGNRRDYVLVDKAGDIHSLARQTKGALAADIREKLKDLDPASIPKARHVQQQLRHARAERVGHKERSQNETGVILVRQTRLLRRNRTLSKPSYGSPLRSTKNPKETRSIRRPFLPP